MGENFLREYLSRPTSKQCPECGNDDYDKFEGITVAGAGGAVLSAMECQICGRVSSVQVPEVESREEP